jgi:hypothetical protein
MATTVEAFKFVFSAADMQKLLDTKPDKVVCVVSIEEETTVDGRKVGALKIIGRGSQLQQNAGDGFEIEGCPIPPCHEGFP